VCFTALHLDPLTAPFRAAKKAGKNDRLMIKANGQKLTSAAKAGKLLQHRLVCFGCPDC